MTGRFHSTGLCLLLLLGAHAAAGQDTLAGEGIYQRGLLPGGRLLRGERDGGAGVQGQAAACVTCHRRSGLGSYEGQSVIPPIIGRYLFRPGARNVEDVELPHVLGYVPRREAYTDQTLARAIRAGVDQQGRTLSYLMPRYRLSDAEVAQLIAFLKGLTSGPVPGVDPETLQFATIITPDADPGARKAMLDVLEQFFADKNGGYRGATPPLQSTRGVMYRVNRKWKLHVWELTGPEAGWEEQLQARLRATPVFAAISGLAGNSWAPVHRFCESARLPCLFPNAELPVVAEQDFYSVYYSKGVLLEARLIARSLADGPGRGALHRVVQLARARDTGEAAARELERAAAELGLEVATRLLPAGGGAREAAAALAGLTPGDALVLWLRPGDLAALPAPPPASTIHLSGLLGGLEAAPLPAAWRGVARMSYPFDLPEARRVRMNFPLGWFKVRHLAVTHERIQTDTYLACVILSETLGHMLDSFVRDYLIERIEVLLSHRQVNGYYPRLGLAPGQRFASKGGYLVHFNGPGPQLSPDGDWTVP